MTYPELKALFRKLKRDHPEEDLTAHIVFTEDSFAKTYPLISRTYTVSSDNKAFWPGMGGYSIFASCLDGTDQCVRLEQYMADEGAADGWKVQECYVLEHMRDADAIADLTQIKLEDDTICYGFGSTCISDGDGKKSEPCPVAGPAPFRPRRTYYAQPWKRGLSP